MDRPLTLAEVRPVPHGRTARRLEWQHLPPHVRNRVETRLGSAVVHASSKTSGFTNGFASVLTAQDGSRCFVKAASTVAQVHASASYTEEARMWRSLPSGIPAPRLLWTFVEEGWVVLAFEHVDGTSPQRPWDSTELDACLAALAEVARITAEPGPGLRLAPLHEDLPTLVTGWDRVAVTAPDWPHLDEVRALAASFADLPDAGHFVHGDARDDNFLVTVDGTALLCDWNWPALGPAWVDTVMLLVSAHGDGVDADALVAGSPMTRGVPVDHVDAWLAALCGFMVEADVRAAPPWSPHLATHRRWWAAATWSWLSRRRGWDGAR